jgi:multiple sugar transport system ATP-binding protein
MRAELSKLHIDLNATMIYVTHDQVEAMTMANKIVVMKDGKIQQIGSPLYLYNHPVNKFVAGFIGSPPMNFLTVKVSEEGGSVVLDEGSFKLKPAPLHEPYLKKYVGKEVFFGIRPEDLIYAENGGGDNSMPVKVTVVEPLGADIHLWLSTETQPLVARTESHFEFKVGSTIRFNPKIEKARYFDKETELSVLVELDNNADRQTGI